MSAAPRYAFLLPPAAGAPACPGGGFPAVLTRGKKPCASGEPNARPWPPSRPQFILPGRRVHRLKIGLWPNFPALARREPRSLEAAGTRGLWVSRKSDWGGSRVGLRLLTSSAMPRVLTRGAARRGIQGGMPPWSQGGVHAPPEKGGRAAGVPAARWRGTRSVPPKLTVDAKRTCQGRVGTSKARSSLESSAPGAKRLEAA